MAIQFVDRLDATPSSTVVSETVVISGLTLGTKNVTIVGADGQLSVDGGAWAAAGVVQNGSQLRLRVMTPPGEEGQAVLVTLDLASVGYLTWRVVNVSNLLSEQGTGAAAPFGMVVIPLPLSDAGSGYDVLGGTAYLLVVEAGNGADTPSGTLRATTLLAEAGSGAGVALTLFGDVLLEAASGSNTLFHAFRDVLGERGLASDALTALTRALGMVLETASGKDAVVTGWASGEVVEVAVAQDNLFGGARLFAALLEAGVGEGDSDEAAPVLGVALLHEVGTGSDALLGQLLARSGLQEVAGGRDRLVDAIADNAAHVFNMRSAAYSSWSGVAPLEVFTVDGELYGLSEDGLYALSDECADAEVYAGLLSLGSDVIKQLTAAYITAASDTEARVAVAPVDQDAVYEYAARPAHIDKPTQTRVDLGRGMRSGLFGVSVANTPGARLRLADVKFIVTNTQRRI